MARLKGGILGAFQGKIGPVVASKRGDTVYIKSRPKTVRHPNTKKQLAAKNSFGVAASLGSLLLPFVKHSIITDKGKTAYKACVSYNKTSAVAQTGNGFEVDYEKLVLSKGELEGLRDAKAERAGAGAIRFSWTDNSGVTGALGDDRVLLLAIAPEHNEIFYRINGANRMDETALLPVPEDLADEPLYVYVSVQTADRTDASPSEYIGCLNC